MHINRAIYNALSVVLNVSISYITVKMFDVLAKYKLLNLQYLVLSKH